MGAPFPLSEGHKSGTLAPGQRSMSSQPPSPADAGPQHVQTPERVSRGVAGGGLRGLGAGPAGICPETVSITEAGGRQAGQESQSPGIRICGLGPHLGDLGKAGGKRLHQDSLASGGPRVPRGGQSRSTLVPGSPEDAWPP